MHRIMKLAVAVFVATAAGACADTDGEDAGAVIDTADTAPGLAPVPAEQVATDGVTLGVDTLQGAGAYLTDGEGRALYMLEGEPSDSSTCYDACAEEWPPLIPEAGSPRAGAASVQQGLIGTIQRRDGRTQVTYGGHALYYYHEDRGPGQTSGQDLTDQWGEWYLVTPEGEHLEESGS